MNAGNNGSPRSLMAAARARWSELDPNLRLFLAGTALLGMAGGMYETTFNNFLQDRYHISAVTRGWLEFPRETPGFLTALFSGALFFLPETSVAAAAALAVGVGMLGLATPQLGWSPMLGWMVLWSVGTHLLMPVRSSISMDLADASRKGRRLGQISGVGAAASIVGCAVVWGAMRLAGAGYSTIYILGGLAGLGAAAALARMRLPGAHLRRPRFVWNRRYWLYYVLAFLFGARKQIFITFGPWVLIKVFGQPAYVIAQLWMAAGVLGILVQPLLGRAIDRFGERAVLTVDAITLFLVCAGYGGAHLIPGRAAALAVLYACFVLDLVLFGVNMARDTYVAKIALKPEHVAPTLSLGVTINHVVSMSIPAAGGWLWARHGHPAVFVAASGVAVLMVAFTACIRVPPTPRAGALRGS